MPARRSRAIARCAVLTATPSSAATVRTDASASPSAFTVAASTSRALHAVGPSWRRSCGAPAPSATTPWGVGMSGRRQRAEALLDQADEAEAWDPLLRPAPHERPSRAAAAALPLDRQLVGL